MDAADFNRILNFFKARKARGISNIGNTCYISTALQCLGHCLSFAYPIIANPTKPDAAPVTNALRDVYKTMWVAQTCVNPSAFVKALRPRVATSMELLTQNDVMEFIMLLIDILNSELGEKGEGWDRNLALKGKQKLYDIMECHWANSHKLARSLLVDIMYGQTVNQTKCDLCGTIEHQGDLFCNLSLALTRKGNGGARLALTDLIDQYFSQEHVKRNCDHCKLRNLDAHKVLRLWRLPQIMIIHLQRFDHGNNKINVEVESPEQLDMDAYTLTSSRVTKYELKAITCHSGSTHGGHYFAVVKNPSGTWYMIDDDGEPQDLPRGASQVSLHHHYILFYELLQ